MYRLYAYRQGDYRNALSLILKANLPGHRGMHAGIAAAIGQLGELEAASKAIRDLLINVGPSGLMDIDGCVTPT